MLPLGRRPVTASVVAQVADSVGHFPEVARIEDDEAVPFGLGERGSGEAVGLLLVACGAHDGSCRPSPYVSNRHCAAWPISWATIIQVAASPNRPDSLRSRCKSHPISPVLVPNPGQKPALSGL